MFGLPEFPVRAAPAGVLYVQQENATDRVKRDFQEIAMARQLGERVVVEYHTAEEMQATGLGTEPVEVSHFDLAEWPSEIEQPPFDVMSHACVDLSLDTMRAALRGRVEEHRYGYVFLDPLYMLVGAVDEIKEAGQLKLILTALTELKNETGCAVILTHHLSDKRRSGSKASLLLASTYLHAWYEAAVFVEQDKSKTFQVEVDAQRSHGSHLKHTLKGGGVGHWFYDEAAQGQEDVLGRSAPAVSRKLANVALYAKLKAENPEWTKQQLADVIGVGVRTVERYEADVAADELLGQLDTTRV